MARSRRALGPDAAARRSREGAYARRLSRLRHRLHAWLALSARMSSGGRTIARELGFTQVSASHEVSPLMKFVGRGDTTVADAYLSPILARYVEQVCARAAAHRRGCIFMTSAGGLTAADMFSGKDAILSGPAGGVVAMAETARVAGSISVIGFDMGGTSTDVAHFDGRVRARLRNRGRGRAHARADDADPHGGGGRRVDSALLTAAASASGRIPPAPIRARLLPPRRAARRHRRQCDGRASCCRNSSPRFSVPSRTSRSTRDVVREKFTALAAEIGELARDARGGRRWLHPHRGREHGRRRSRRFPCRAAMTSRDYALNCFGGAGGQHACLVADALGMRRVLHPPLSSGAVGLWHGARRQRVRIAAGER